MVRLISSEWMKTKRTMVRWINFFLPLLISGCIIGYVALRGMSSDFQMTTFQTFFEIWTIFVIPIGVGILAGYVVHQEELASSFNGFLSLRLPRYKLYLVKFFPLSIIIMISTFLATIVFYIGITLIFPELSNIWLFFLIAAILVIIGTLPIIAIHLWVSFAWGTGVSIGIGICGLLMAGLIGRTSLGNSIWQFIPWTVPVRLVKNLSPYLLFSANMTTPPPLVSSGWAVKQFLIGITSVGVCLFIVLLCGMIWFSKWEGRKYYE
ncbi:lantibiotic immunity ABC transporter MutG family permease subunit [Peptostreptococcus canis]|uniref:Lantibiotic immunity ABC transporter MutG family permease subunit n=1 Tax=Peptostreptococcus canis TaxID=1159213 RepID=A0ABR6TLK1_9FIRM|nr:lantibiotic immunity ABC transporter MutG family permease subunit [Peptostreptococcus canis]MBC2576282.1 lantibiotic immunity ABC transporter MutG family permease subunit [Peptostreptococcus canis]MBP1998477.1 ABC-2 type transport system permease protein [Peptostreptococcus canis]